MLCNIIDSAAKTRAIVKICIITDLASLLFQSRLTTDRSLFWDLLTISN